MSTPPPPPPSGSGQDPNEGQDSNGGQDSYADQSEPRSQPEQQPYGYDPQSQGGSSSYNQGQDQGEGYGAGGYQPAPGYYGGQAPSEVDNNFGIIALVTGLIGLLACQPLGIVAIIYGRKAQAAETAGRATNGTLGVVGFWLGVVALVLFALAILAFILAVAGLISVGVFESTSY